MTEKYKVKTDGLDRKARQRERKGGRAREEKWTTRERKDRLKRIDGVDWKGQAICVSD